MQRVASELHRALEQHERLSVRTVALRTSWRWTHLRTGPFLLRTLAMLGYLAVARKADVVLFSSMVTASLAVPLRRLFRANGIRTAAIVHGRDVTLPGMVYQRFVPRVFASLDRVFPVSRATAEACRQRGLAEHKVQIIPNGIDTRRFGKPERGRRSLVAARFPADGLPEEALLLCSVGRQVERKGSVWFVTHVMPRLPEQVHYWIAGEGPEHPRLSEAIARFNLAHRVQLLGRVSEETLTALYRGADLFIMPNIPVPGDMEGFGVVILEAGLNGLPVVASHLEGIADVVAEGRNGHLVESRNASAFIERIRYYMDDRERLRSASGQAEQYTRETYGWPAVADRYAEALQRLVRDDNHPSVR